MTISAINGVSQYDQQNGQSQAVTPVTGVSAFGQELDSQTAQTGTAQAHHHHHHAGASQSVTSSASAAASAAGVTSPSTLASSLLSLLS